MEVAASLPNVDKIFSKPKTPMAFKSACPGGSAKAVGVFLFWP
jgi:hypothetical protein